MYSKAASAHGLGQVLHRTNASAPAIYGVLRNPIHNPTFLINGVYQIWQQHEVIMSLLENYTHRSETDVRVTARVFTGDVEAFFDVSQWIPGLSPWRSFRFSVYTDVTGQVLRFQTVVVTGSFTLHQITQNLVSKSIHILWLFANKMIRYLPNIQIFLFL